MLLSDFITLTAEEKMVILLHDATLVGEHPTQSGLCYLFQMERFYVEAFCPSEGADVTEYRCFTCTDLLQPYLESISLQGIID